MSDTFRTHDGRNLQQAASDLVQREVLCCLSSMVSTLAGDAYNLPQSNTEKLCSQAVELSAPVLDYEEAAREAGWKTADMTKGMLINEKLLGEGPGDCAVVEPARDGSYDWNEACEVSGIEPHELEVYEHWAVSTWFAEKLQAAGERVDTDFAGLNVWARTTTGQAISIDHVVEKITMAMHKA